MEKVERNSVEKEGWNWVIPVSSPLVSSGMPETNSSFTRALTQGRKFLSIKVQSGRPPAIHPSPALSIVKNRKSYQRGAGGKTFARLRPSNRRNTIHGSSLLNIRTRKNPRQAINAIPLAVLIYSTHH